MKRVLAIHASVQQIEPEEAPLVFEIRLVGQLAGAADEAEVLGVNQLRLRQLTPNLLHGARNAPNLVYQRARKSAVTALVRVPVPVQAAEARGGERFVDRREA